MPNTFTFDENIVTWLDYARFRVDDKNIEEPFLFDETYLSLYARFGPIEGLALAASNIALNIAKQVSSFGEAAGIRFSKQNLDYYEELPDLIRREPPFLPDASSPYKAKLIRLGKLKAGSPASLVEAETQRVIFSAN